MPNTPRQFILPNYDYLPENMQRFALELGEILKRHFENVFLDLVPRSSVLPDGDTTPSVKNGSGKVFVANNTAGTTVTDLDDAEDGMVVQIICVQNITINDGGNFALSANWTPNANDTLTLAFRSNVFYELSRSAN